MEEPAGPNSTMLAKRRLHARVAMEQVARRVHVVLEQERAHTESTIPSAKIDELDSVDKDLEGELDEAYVTLNNQLAVLKRTITSVRDLERRVHPCQLGMPAVMTLAVSAPSTSWALDVVSLTPLTRLAAVVTTVFTASFSNPLKGADDNSNNKLKRCWAADKKNKKRKKKRTADALMTGDAAAE
jgi:hypothetical protein